MRLDEISDDTPLIFTVVQKLLAKGERVKLSVKQDDQFLVLGWMFKAEYDSDSNDYTFFYKSDFGGSSTMTTYFTHAAWLETFQLKKHYDQMSGGWCWLLKGEWEMPNDVA
jgi:hypothetical protein